MGNGGGQCGAPPLRGRWLWSGTREVTLPPAPGTSAVVNRKPQTVLVLTLQKGC